MTFRILRAALAIAAIATVSLAAEKQPLTHEAMWLMWRVSAPALSPDGKTVVFTVVEPSYDESAQVTDLWIAPADGSAKPRKLTGSKAAESDVAWSPDSRRIAFAAKRDGDEVNQIYVLDVAAGGEAQRITSSSSGARQPRFRPDGNAILFSSGAYPDAADDEANKAIAKQRKDKKEKVRVYESFPIRHWDRWLDDSQMHLHVQSLDAGSKARDLLAGTNLIKEPGFAGRYTSSGQEMDAAWAPDGRSVIFVATTNRNASAYQNVVTQLYQVGIDGGEPRVIAREAGSYLRPRFSADGRTLFAVFEPASGKTYSHDRLVAFDWPSMRNRRVITGPPFDRAVGSYDIASDGKTIYFTAQDAGLERLHAVSVAGGEVKVVADQDRGTFTAVQVAQKAAPAVIVALWGSSVNPPEVVRIDPASRKQRNITDFNVAKAAAIDWQPPRHFWFTSSRGKQIHNMLVVPEKFDETRKYPLFVLMHGGPHSMWRDEITRRWNYHLLAKPGYVMLLTNYTGSTGFTETFAQDILGDPLKGPAQEINEAADEAIKRFPFIDGSRQVAAGASYGGHLANWMQATTTRYKALLSHAGLINMESQWGTSDTIWHREVMSRGPVWEQGAVWREQNPIRFAANFKTPMLLSVGEKDYRVPLNQTLENWSVLQRMRVPSRLLVWPDENHWILNGENSRYFYEEVAGWMARWLQ
jgi:dipeptidyl aminopeptidase/acylaminoacyl peptidase